jgi:hypothetical protein
MVTAVGYIKSVIKAPKPFEEKNKEKRKKFIKGQRKYMSILGLSLQEKELI